MQRSPIQENITNPSYGYITPNETKDTSLLKYEVAHTKFNQNDDSEVREFDKVAKTGQSSRFDLSGLREGEIGAFDPYYTIGKIPYICDLCIAGGERNVAVKMCNICRKQLCKSCEDTQTHLETCDSRDREIRSDDGKYIMGKMSELCELCIPVEERNVAVKFCITCKKQICTTCLDTQKHIDICDPRNRVIRAIAEDAADDNYAVGRIPDLCDLCVAVGEHKVAVKYCLSCEKTICISCADAHKRFQALMSHAIVDTGSLESKLQLTSTKCEHHEKKDLDRFCITHNIFCCMICSVKHTECTVTTNIADIESVSKRTLTFVKEKYQQIENYMEKVRSKNLESEAEFRKKIENLKRLLDTRTQNIKTALEVIQTNFDVTSKQLLSFTEMEIQSSIKEIDKVKFLCRKTVENIDNILETGHPVHVLAMHNVVIDEFQNAASYIDRKDIKEEIFHCRLKLLSTLHNVHENLVAQADETVKFVRGQVCIQKCDDIVNVLRNRKVIRTNEHNIRLVPNCTPRYSAIAATTGGKHLVLSDCCDATSYCGNVCLYDIRNRSQIKLKLKQPFGVAVLRFEKLNIAVTLPLEKQILIISTDENCLTTVKTFHTYKVPFSLVSLGSGCIGATFHSPPSFDFIDISGKHIKTLNSYTQDSTGRAFKTFRFVAVDKFRSHIIQPCQEENAVYSFDYSGQPVFEYRDSELKSPQGVSLDRDGNIYICSFFNHMLHVLAPTGTKVKYVKTGVPSCPRAICFDETGQRFWMSGTATDSLESLYVFSLRE